MQATTMRRIGAVCFAIGMGSIAPLASAAQRMPFEATIGITEQFGDPSANCFLTSTVLGRGTATALGAVSLTAADCINPLPPDFTSAAFTSKQVVLKAANGDELYAMYAGIHTADGAINGGYFIVGGTGAFKKAAGSGVMQGVETGIDPTTFTATGQIQLKGVISF